MTTGKGRDDAEEMFHGKIIPVQALGCCMTSLCKSTTHCTAPHSTALHRTAPHRTAPHRTVLYEKRLATSRSHLFLSYETDCPGSGCIGGEMQGDLLCLRTQTILCRPAQEENADTCCLCFRGYGMCVYPASLCAFRSTLFCLDQRCAIPTNDEVPCMCTLCGATCYYGSGEAAGAQFHCECGGVG